MRKIDPRVAAAARLNGLAFRSLEFGGFEFATNLAALLESDAPIDRSVRMGLAQAIRGGRINFGTVTQTEKAKKSFADRAHVKYAQWRKVGLAREASGLSWGQYWAQHPIVESIDEIQHFNSMLEKYLASGSEEGVTHRKGRPLSEVGLQDALNRYDTPRMVQDFCTAYSHAETRHDAERAAARKIARSNKGEVGGQL